MYFGTYISSIILTAQYSIIVVQWYKAASYGWCMLGGFDIRDGKTAK